MQLEDFDYSLPDELIAQAPLATRASSRLLHVDSGQPQDLLFSQLLDLVEAGDVLVFNDTRVMKARLFGVKQSGGKVEILVERVLSPQRVLAQVRASHSPQVGSELRLADRWTVKVIAKQGNLVELQFNSDETVWEILEQSGCLPLPPYIHRAAGVDDETRYQTIFAKELGAVAAPTAGLHFDQAMLDRLQAKGAELAYVTLHVGAGTFQPIRYANITEHKMHSEQYHIPAATVEAINRAKAAGKRIMAVGTTSLRALEAAALNGELQIGSGETNLFITPGFQFKVVDRLLTNFHLPKSTLLILVSAFAGLDVIRNAYRHAIAQRYRFFSYGDAMLLERSPSNRGQDAI